jgi:hypothetical protein
MHLFSLPFIILYTIITHFSFNCSASHISEDLASRIYLLMSACDSMIMSHLAGGTCRKYNHRVLVTSVTRGGDGKGITWRSRVLYRGLTSQTKCVGCKHRVGSQDIRFNRENPNKSTFGYSTLMLKSSNVGNDRHAVDPNESTLSDGTTLHGVLVAVVSSEVIHRLRLTTAYHETPPRTAIGVQPVPMGTFRPEISTPISVLISVFVKVST